MASAIEKFIAAMNQTSPFWTKTLEATAQEGEIVLIRCDGFTFKTDQEEINGNPNYKHTDKKL